MDALTGQTITYDDGAEMYAVTSAEKSVEINLIIEVLDMLWHLCLNALIQQALGQSQVIKLQIKTGRK